MSGRQRIRRAETVLLVVAATREKLSAQSLTDFYEIIEGQGAQPVLQTQSGEHETHKAIGRRLQRDSALGIVHRQDRPRTRIPHACTHIASLGVDGTLASFIGSRLLQQAGGGSENFLGGMPAAVFAIHMIVWPARFRSKIGTFIGVIGRQPIDGRKAFDQTIKRAAIVAAFPTRKSFVYKQTSAIDCLVDVVRQGSCATQPVRRLGPFAPNALRRPRPVDAKRSAEDRIRLAASSAAAARARSPMHRQYHPCAAGSTRGRRLGLAMVRSPPPSRPPAAAPPQDR